MYVKTGECVNSGEILDAVGLKNGSKSTRKKVPHGMGRNILLIKRSTINVKHREKKSTMSQKVHETINYQRARQSSTDPTILNGPDNP